MFGSWCRMLHRYKFQGRLEIRMLQISSIKRLVVPRKHSLSINAATVIAMSKRTEPCECRNIVPEARIAAFIALEKLSLTELRADLFSVIDEPHSFHR